MREPILENIEKNCDANVLRQEDGRFCDLLENAPLPCSSMSRHGELIAVNQAWLGTLGYARGEVIGKLLEEFLVPEAAGMLRDTLLRHGQGQGRRDAELEMVRKNGSSLAVRLQSTADYDAGGRCQRIWAVFQDVTESYNLAEEKRNLEIQLDRIKKIRTGDVLSRPTAHDFNNMLGVILGYGQMALADLETDTRIRRDVEKMVQAGKRAKELLRTILSSGGPDDGPSPPATTRRDGCKRKARCG